MLGKHIWINLFAFLGLTLFQFPANADSPAPWTTYAKSSIYGEYFFLMNPNSWKYGYYVDEVTPKDTPPYGIAYQVLNDGSFKELWRTEGWYSFEVYLSADGEHLARIGNWAVGSEPSQDDLAVAFYRKGVLIKSYSTADLITDKKKVSASTSHYEWRPSGYQQTGITWGNNFQIKTIDGWTYDFDITSGEVISRKASEDSYKILRDVLDIVIWLLATYTLVMIVLWTMKSFKRKATS